MYDAHEVHIGPEDSNGTELTIIRCFLTEPDPHESEYTTIKYRCHGVESIDVQDPWEMGTLEPSSTICVRFTTGVQEYVSGVIIEVEGLEY